MKKGELAFTALVNWCKSKGYLIPVKEYPLLKDIGRKHRADAAWPDLKIALEFQGGVYKAKGGHTGGKNVEDDYEKFALAATLGWRVIPCSYKQFNSGQVYTWLEKVLI